MYLSISHTFDLLLQEVYCRHKSPHRTHVVQEFSSRNFPLPLPSSPYLPPLPHLPLRTITMDNSSTNIKRSPQTVDTPDNHSHSHSQDDHHHSHVHSEASLKQIVNRLSRIEGHIRGIKTMVQDSRPCPDVLVQIAAVRGAMDRVARLILDEHMNECVVRASQEGNIEAELAELKAALDRFLP